MKKIEFSDVITYLLEYFLKRYNNKHYNFIDPAELKGLVSNALEERYIENGENKIFVINWPNETKTLKITDFEVIVQNIDVLCNVFYASYEHYFKNF